MHVCKFKKTDCILDNYIERGILPFSETSVALCAPPSLSSQKYEIWKKNVASRVNSLACSLTSWRSFDCRPPRWTWPALASLTTPVSLF